MEALQSISELKIQTDKIYYDKKSKVLVVELPGFTFIGNYNKNTRISLILNDIHKVLEEKGIKIDRNDVDIVDASTLMNIHGNTKLKKLPLIDKKEVEEEGEKKRKKEKEKPAAKEKESQFKVSTAKKKRKGKADMDVADMEYDAPLKRMEEPILDSFEEAEEEAVEDVELLAALEKKKYSESPPPAPSPPPAEAPAAGGGPPPAPGGAPSGPPARAKASRPMAPPPPPSPAPTTTNEGGETMKSLRDEMFTELDGLKDEMKSEDADDLSGFGAFTPPKQYEYKINMGLQYYSVMMEKRSYLFYVYFSHQVLRIADEEGKTVYTTTVKIVTKKKEPPVMDLRIEGEGFEVHPLSGKVEVSKSAVNPPVMIFSIMPTKSNRLKKIKESERRFINVFIDFEGATISHTILSVIVQPKHFRMNLGPIHFNMNKGTAITVSIISIAISVLLLLYSILTLDITDITGADIITGIVPQIGSFLFVGFFLYTVIQGVYPIKQQFEGLLNFDKDTSITK